MFKNCINGFLYIFLIYYICICLVCINKEYGNTAGRPSRPCTGLFSWLCLLQQSLEPGSTNLQQVKKSSPIIGRCPCVGKNIQGLAGPQGPMAVKGLVRRSANITAMRA